MTDASQRNQQVSEVDATACTNGCSEMLSVLSPLDLAVVQFLTAGDHRRKKRKAPKVSGQFPRRILLQVAGCKGVLLTES